NTVAIRGIENYGSVYLSHKVFGDNLGREATRSDVSLNKVKVGNYVGKEGSVLYYQGFLGGKPGSENSSYLDVVYADTASGQSKVYFINEDGKFGAFSQSRGETVGEGGTNGILIFEVKDPNEHVDLAFPDGQTRIGVVAKDNETHVKFYRLNEQGDGNDWYLVNKADGDAAIPWTPIEPPEEPEVPVVPPENPDLPKMPDNPTSPTPDDEGNTLRPEGGAYMANSQAWAKMHMRLHDRFGQAYYIDPFDGKEKPAAAWVRQVGSHSHFKSGGGESRTHARTAVTQIGADLIRNEINEDWKYIGGVFAGGLYHRANTRTYASAKSRSDGYAVGIYGTLYTGNSPDDEFYVDSWLLYGRYDNKLWGETTSTFNYKSHGWVWSVESGYTIPLGESGTKDFNKVIWTFQPEVQVVWDGVKANDGYDATDTKYKQLGKDNVAIRVGARVHGNYMNKGLGFIEGNWIHNTKKTGVQMGSAKTYMDGGRNLGEFRMGLEGHITRNTLGWATVGVQAGKAGYHNETAQIGIKYMF
ncbi:autotransporter outer membrane beta-barrel domain-containing protein, partial [uncultured Parasutterella sp.]